MKALSNSAVCPNCGSGHKSKPFCLYDNGYFCFSCNYAKSADRSFTNITREIQTNTPDFPEAISDYNDFPIAVKRWLLERGVGESLCRKHSIMCCEDNSVIYINLDDEGKLISYQQRWILSKERRIITKGVKTPTLLNEVGSGFLVVVEDYLSAIRVAEQYDCLCLWGTTLNYSSLKEICKQYDKIFLCLDNDHDKEINSGQEAAKILAQKIQKEMENSFYYRGFTLYSKKFVNIVAEKDLKYYTDSEIRNIIIQGAGL